MSNSIRDYEKLAVDILAAIAEECLSKHQDVQLDLTSLKETPKDANKKVSLVL